MSFNWKSLKQMNCHKNFQNANPPAPYSLQWNMFYSNDLNRISFLSKITALFGFYMYRSKRSKSNYWYSHILWYTFNSNTCTLNWLGKNKANYHLLRMQDELYKWVIRNKSLGHFKRLCVLLLKASSTLQNMYSD